ncbi:MAG: bifunctional pyr operon transcriptional regulator/uracil phosphoribosyltransferase PyrR [Bacteroidota bacterium]
MKNYTLFIGIDISKECFDVAINENGILDQMSHKRFKNNAKGFRTLVKWIKKSIFRSQNSQKNSAPARTILETKSIFATMKESAAKTLMNHDHIQIVIERLCQQLIESHEQFDQTCIIGIQAKGVLLADIIHQRLLSILDIEKIEYGKLDITFYRDDFRTRDRPLMANRTEIDFYLEEKNVILVDDVVFTGRTIQAAMTALNHYGRPKRVELLALIDRRFNRHLPIKTDYVGQRVDSLDHAYVKVELEQEQAYKVLLFN